MNYDLAKQLRDAGFPQGGNGKWIGRPGIGFNPLKVSKGQEHLVASQVVYAIKAVTGEILRRSRHLQPHD
jgi:hypothetical protein